MTESEVSEQALDISDGESSEEEEGKAQPSLASIKEDRITEENDQEMGSSQEQEDGIDDITDELSTNQEPVKQEPMFPDTSIELQHVKGDT